MPFSDILLPFLLTAVAAYIIGSISFSIIITRIFAKTDVREHGSGNAGTTNVLRTAGKLPAALTFLFDFLKCVAAIYFGLFLFQLFNPQNIDATVIKFVAGLFCLLGHIYPLYFGFRGGKGVVTTAALIFMISWQCFLIAISIFILMALLTRLVSLSTIVAASSLPVTMYIVMWLTKNEYRIVNTFFALVMTIILIIMHRSNICRLLNGTEHKIGEKTHIN
jgi:glycerol-3-phosphate acyltransferase PlsY